MGQEVKIAIAGNYSQYLNWLRENKLTPREIRYVECREHLYGLRLKKENIFLIGTYENKTDLLELLHSRIEQ